MKFVVKECLRARFRACAAGAHSIFPRNDLVRIAAGPEYRKRQIVRDPARHRRFFAANGGVLRGRIGKSIRNAPSKSSRACGHRARLDVATRAMPVLGAIHEYLYRARL
jgi:hypothetical protein